MEEKVFSFDELHGKSLKNRSLNLTAGNPFSVGASFVRDAMVEAICSPEMGRYSAASGEAWFKDTISTYIKAKESDGGMGITCKRYSSGNIVLGCGITQLWAAYAFYIKEISDKKNENRRAKGLSPKEPVIIMPELTYGLCLNILKSYDIKVYGIPLHKETGYRLQAQDIEKTISEIEQDGKKEVLCLKVDNPSNPIGSVLEKEDVESIMKICCEKKINVFDDLAYYGLENNKKAFPFASLQPQGKYHNLHDYIFTACNLSKAGSFPGARAAFGVGPTEVVSKIIEHIANTTAALSYSSQVGIVSFFDIKNTEKKQAFLANQRNEYAFRGKMMAACINGIDSVSFSDCEKEKLEQVINEVDETNNQGIQNRIREMLQTGIDGVTINNPHPEAGFFYLLQFNKFNGDDTTLMNQIIDHKGPFMLPASFLTVPRFNHLKLPHQKPCARVTFSFEKTPIILLSMYTLKESLQAIEKENKKNLQLILSQNYEHKK